MKLKKWSVTKILKIKFFWIEKGCFYRIGNRNEKSYNPISHVEPFFKQVDFYNVKYCFVIDLMSLYITINGNL